VVDEESGSNENSIVPLVVSTAGVCGELGHDSGVDDEFTGDKNMTV
jgi:hypothetical protein